MSLLLSIVAGILCLLWGGYLLRAKYTASKDKEAPPPKASNRSFRPRLFVDVDSSHLIHERAMPQGTPYYIVIDTETFDPIQEYEIDTSATLSPAVALSWQLLTKEGLLISEESFVLKRAGHMSQDAIELHGITNHDLQEGANPHRIYAQLSEAIASSTMLVAHNLSFHLSVIQQDMQALGLSSERLTEKPQLCTMQWGKAKGFKRRQDGVGLYPRLDELFAHLYFGCLSVDLQYSSKSLRDVRLVSASLRKIIHAC